MHKSATRARAAVIAASSSLAAGAAIVAYGLYADDLTPALGGGCLTITSSVLLALAKIRVWTADTSAERTRLADATQRAEDEHTRYIALTAAADLETQRIRRDADAEREAGLARLKAERAALTERLEQDRARMACEALDTAFQLIKAGICDEPQPEQHARVIELPGLARQRQRETGAAPLVRDREAYRP